VTIELHDAVNGDGLFDVQGKAFGALETLLTAIETTVPDAIEDFLEQYQLRADAYELDVWESMEGLPAAVSTWQLAGGTLSGRVRTNLEQFLIQVVDADAEQPESTLVYSLQYLIDQMIADGDYVAGNTITLELTPDGDNSGDLAIAYTECRDDGLVNQNIYDETITVTVYSTTAQRLRFRSPAAKSSRLAHDWPGGSGINVLPTTTAATSSLLSNGDFEDETIENVPDDWIVDVGTVGTTLKVTGPEEQTVTISGTPTGGSYLLQWTDLASTNHSTEAIAYNAAAATVQAALRAIPGLELVTVSSTGTSPDYTHTVVFENVPGNPDQLTSVNHLTGGSSPTIAHATTVAGSDGVYRGRALEFDSNGSELTAVYHALAISDETVYFTHLRVKRVGATAAGEVRVEIVDGIDGSVVQDEAGNAAELVLTAADISDSDHDSEWFSFRLPAGQLLPVYLRIRISVAVDNTCSVFFDDVAIAEARRLYAGGPYVAVFAGRTPPGADDTWDLAASNDRAGSIQEWYNRVFNMADKDLLLPVTGDGDEIPPSWT